MPRKVIVCLALLVIGILAAAVGGSPAAASANKPVKVDAKCPQQSDGKFSISVDPFEVVVVPGQDVKWNLYTNNSKNEVIRISAKNPAEWLYADTSVEGNKEVVMTEMVDASPDKSYEYQVTVYCGESEPVVLDPRIRVGGG